MSKQNSVSNDEQDDVKLEDILNSIRGIISDHQQVVKSNKDNEEDFFTESDASDEEILELTDVMESNGSRANETLISERIRDTSASMINNFIKTAGEKSSYDATELETVVHKLMRPMIKDWLDNNLLVIVEKIITEEIKKLVPKR